MTRALEEGFIDENHVLPIEMENLAYVFRTGLLGEDKFDTATSFSFPYLDQKKDSLVPAADNAATKILSSVEKEMLGRARTPEERKNDMDLMRREKIPVAVASILHVLKPSGTLLISGSYLDLVPEVFRDFGLECKVHEVEISGALEDVVYVGKNKE